MTHLIVRRTGLRDFDLCSVDCDLGQVVVRQIQVVVNLDVVNAVGFNYTWVLPCIIVNHHQGLCCRRIFHDREGVRRAGPNSPIWEIGLHDEGIGLRLDIFRCGDRAGHGNGLHRLSFTLAFAQGNGRRVAPVRPRRGLLRACRRRLEVRYRHFCRRSGQQVFRQQGLHRGLYRSVIPGVLLRQIPGHPLQRRLQFSKRQFILIGQIKGVGHIIEDRFFGLQTGISSQRIGCLLRRHLIGFRGIQGKLDHASIFIKELAEGRNGVIQRIDRPGLIGGVDPQAAKGYNNLGNAAGVILSHGGEAPSSCILNLVQDFNCFVNRRLNSGICLIIGGQGGDDFSGHIRVGAAYARNIPSASRQLILN